ncbi:MAG: hypothetical protein ACK4IX_16405 [Candidatus Sericytochromatia bacterium]
MTEVLYSSKYYDITKDLTVDYNPQGIFKGLEKIPTKENNFYIGLNNG